MADSNTTQTPPAPPKRRRMRRLLVAVLVLLALVAGLLALAPSLACSKAGLSRLSALASSRLNGTLTIDAASLAWFGPQQLEQIRLLDPAGQTVLSIEQVHLGTGLWDLLTGSGELGRIDVTGLQARIIADRQGGNNLMESVAAAKTTRAPDKQADRPFRLPGTFELLVRQANVQLVQPDGPPVELTNLTLEARVEQLGKPLTASLAADTRQGPLAGRIEQRLTLDGFDDQGRLQQVKLSATSNVTGLPLAGLDSLMGRPGLLATTLGRRLDCRAELSCSDSRTFTGRILASCDHLQTDLTVTTDLSLVRAGSDRPPIENLLAALHLGGEIRLADMPVASLDKALHADGLLLEILGPTADLTVRPHTDDQHRHHLAAVVTSPRLNATFRSVIDKTTVTTTGRLTALARPQLADRLLRPPADKAHPDASAPLQLTGPVTLQADLEKLTLPLDRFDPTRLAARASVELSDSALSYLPAAPSTPKPAAAPSNAPATARLIAWSGLSATLATDNLAQALNLSVNGSLHHADRTGRLQADTRLANLFDKTGRPRFDQSTIDGKIRLTDLPTALLDALAGLDGWLIDALDNRLSLSADLVSKSPQHISATVRLTSPTVNAQAAFLADDRQLALTGPATVRFVSSKPLSNRLLKALKPLGLASADPARPLAADLAIDQLALARPPAGMPFNLQSLRLAFSATLSGDVQLTGLQQTGPLLLAGTRLSAKGRPADLSWSLATRARPQPDCLAGALTRGPADIQAHGRLARQKDKPYALPDWQLAIKSPGLNTTLAGSLDPQMNLALSRKAQVDLTVSDQLLDQLVPTRPASLPRLARPVTARLTIDRLSAPAGDFSPAGLTLAFSVVVSDAQLNVDPVGPIRLSDLAAAFVVDGPANHLALQAQARTRLPGNPQATPGRLEASADLDRWLDKTGQIQLDTATGPARVNIEDLPVALAESLAGRPGAFQPLTGTLADLKAQLQLTGRPDRPGRLNLAVASNKLNGSVDLAVGNRTIALAQSDRPGRFTLALDDPALQALQTLLNNPSPTPHTRQKPTAADTPPPAPTSPTPPPAFHLLEPTTVSLDLHDLHYRLPNPPAGPAKTAAPKPPDSNPTTRPPDSPSTPDKTDRPDPSLAGMALDLAVRTEGLAVRFDQPRTAVHLARLEGRFASKDLSAGGRLWLRTALADAPQRPALLADVQLADLTDTRTGRLNYDHVTFTGDVKLDQLPTALLDAFYPAQIRPSVLLGPTASLSVQPRIVNGTGPLTITLHSPYAVADIPARIDRGLLRLDRHVTARLIVTEQLSRAVINHPLLKQVVRSLEPVELTIFKSATVSRDGRTETLAFQLPLRDFDITRTTLPRLTINPGKLVVRKAGLVKQLLELPQTVGTLARLRLGQAVQGLREDEMLAWFTPVDLSLVGGVATYSRMDMLLGENYQVATWGTLNLGKRPITVGPHTIRPGEGRMILGIAERAMRRVYGITAFENEPQYVDQFIMQGPVDSLTADTGELKTRLMALIGLGAASQIAGQTVGNTGIRILQDIGKIRDTIDTVTGKQEKVKKRQFDPPPPPRTPFPWPEEVKPQASPQEQQQQPDTGTGEKSAAPQTPDDQKQQNNPVRQPDKTDDAPPEEKIIRDVLEGLFK